MQMAGRESPGPWISARSIAAIITCLVITTACSHRSSSTHGYRSASRPAPASQAGYARRGTYKLGRPYTVRGQTYVPRHQPNYDVVGLASWYGNEFVGSPTANGETFSDNRMTAAHPTLPLPSLVRVTNLSNGRQIVVRVNDRGPFVGGRIIDLSKRAAHALGYVRNGTARVRVQYIGPARL